ncbi:MAG: CHRD domain-containing protein [Chloroflexota bacterium]|nr:CHRD domain-containing protein [Chloroflexota bacterium]
MRKRRWFSALIFAIPAVLAVATIAVAGDSGKRNFKADALSGYQEAPAISTIATGSFEASLNNAGDEITYTLSYSDLEGSVTQAHIHLGQRDVAGGVSVFLCSNLGNGPAGTQPCPPSPATVTGTFTASSIVGPAGQGLTTGEFEELVRAIRAGMTYANVHSTKFPGGETRGQINDNDRRGKANTDD